MGKLIENPIETPDGGIGERWYECSMYEICLNISDRSGWSGFSCSECKVRQENAVFDIEEFFPSENDR